jgi:hypothetical protein
MAHCTALPLAAVTRVLFASAFPTTAKQYIGLLSQSIIKLSMTFSSSHTATLNKLHQPIRDNADDLSKKKSRSGNNHRKKPTAATRSLTPNLQRTSHHITSAQNRYSRCDCSVVMLSGANIISAKARLIGSHSWSSTVLGDDLPNMCTARMHAGIKSSCLGPSTNYSILGKITETNLAPTSKIIT